MEDYKFTQKAPKIQEIFDRTLAGNKEYMPRDYSGMGRIYLDRNVEIVDNMRRCWLEQSMMTQPNTIYIIQDDFTISQDNDNTINVPNGSVLMFEGGSISNGVLHSDDSFEIFSSGKCLSNIIFSGKCRFSVIPRLEWFVSEYPENILDTSVDNTSEVRQCIECGTVNVMFPTDKFIRITETIVVENTVNILTDERSRYLSPQWTNNQTVRLEQFRPCVFSDTVVTLFHFKLGNFYEYKNHKGGFIIGNLTFAVNIEYTDVTHESVAIPIIKIDNRYSNYISNNNVVSQYFRGIVLNCTVCSVERTISLNPEDRQEGGIVETHLQNYTGIEVTSIDDPIEFVEINGDIFAGICVRLRRAENPTRDNWFNDVIVRGNMEGYYGVISDCGGPLVVYGTHQSRKMPSCIYSYDGEHGYDGGPIYRGYFTSNQVFLFGFVWDVGRYIRQGNNLMPADTQMQALNNIINGNFIPYDNGLNPRPVCYNDPITTYRRSFGGVSDISIHPNLMYSFFRNTHPESDIIQNLSYQTKCRIEAGTKVNPETGQEATYYKDEQEYVDSLFNGRLINEHCLFNDNLLYYSLSLNYNRYAINNGAVDVAYSKEALNSLKISFTILNDGDFSQYRAPLVLMIGSWRYVKRNIHLTIQKKNYPDNNNENEITTILDKYIESHEYSGEYYRLNLSNLYSEYAWFYITIEIDYRDYTQTEGEFELIGSHRRKLLPFISIVNHGGNVPKFRSVRDPQLLPTIDGGNKGVGTFLESIGKPTWWNGSDWITADGYAAGVKCIGTTLERPTGFNLNANDNGFEYFDTDLNKPIFATLIDTVSGLIIWRDAGGNLVDFPYQNIVNLEHGRGAGNDLRLDIDPETGHMETVESFMARARIRNIEDCLYSNNQFSAAIIDANAGDIISILGVATSHRRMYYVISQTALDDDGPYYPVIAVDELRDEYPDSPYSTLVNITEKSWVVVMAWNEDALYNETPAPYHNKAEIPYKVLHYTNYAPDVIPAYGYYADRPTDALDETMIGFQYFATDLGDNGKPIYWNGTIWVDAEGSIIEQEPEPTPEPSQEEPENQ